MPRPESPAPFPVFLDLAGRTVLVVGGGDAAVAKCRLLLPTGAEIRCVTPVPDAALLELEGRIALHRRPFRPDDLEAVSLCYVALDDAAEAASVVTEARARGVLVNAVDRPSLCDFTTPAMVRRGPIAIAIGTAGLAPALARDLRLRIETAIPPAFSRLAAFCARWRDRVAASLPDRDDRRRTWDDALAGPEAAAILDRDDDAAADDTMAARLAGRPVRLGRATLVGAGPGDPDLLTVAALRALSRADVILYDKLVDPRVLDLARRDARRLDVGKRCGRHSMNQAAINALLVREVASGAHVVRLKGGDPFVFGRGGEELEALREAGAEVEVIPGITTALAVGARLGIPLTHRGASRGLHLITAHGSDGDLPAQDWGALARSGGTLGVYMGVRNLPKVVAALLAAGMSPATPAIAVENATLPAERRVRASLGDMTAALSAVDGPTLFLVGEVVALADRLGRPQASERHAA